GGEERHRAPAGDGQGRAQGQGSRGSAGSSRHDRTGSAGAAEVARTAVCSAQCFTGGARMHWIVAGLIAGVGAFFADYVTWGAGFERPLRRPLARPPVPVLTPCRPIAERWLAGVSSPPAQRRMRMGPMFSSPALEDGSGSSHSCSSFGRSAALITGDEGDAGL